MGNEIPELYNDIYKIMSDLTMQSKYKWSDRIFNDVRSGSTGLEILSSVRCSLESFSESPDYEDIDDILRFKISQLIEKIEKTIE